MEACPNNEFESTSKSILSSMSCLNDNTDAAAAQKQASTNSLLALGDSFLVDENYEEAVSAYTAALKQPNNNNLDGFRILAHRSAAYYHLKQYEKALEDAQNAPRKLEHHDVSCLRRGESEVCIYREGLAALALGRAEYARALFESAQQMAITSGREFWKYQKHLALCDEKLHAATKTGNNTTKNDQEESIAEADSPAVAAAPPAPSARSSNDSMLNTVPKYQYYQSDKFVTIQILEPRVEAEDLNVRFQKNHLVVTLRKANKLWTVICGELYDEIDVERSKTMIKDDKVVLKIAKSNVSYEWPELLGKAKIGGNVSAATAADESLLSADSSMSEADAPEVAARNDTGTSPPLANRPRPYTSGKDWDKIEKDIAKEVEDETDPTNKLFQMIYGNADEDTKRAMIKSYQTSGGTVLSTDWNEVKKADYEKERTAPKGMEWKSDK
ncbi:hypothetical protein MPSEU_000602200 [Mayamaea pseudoterrestris]|nr:hypothetical protein MPSEU_000602200 [Mayamaea pseudoterrestris]